MKLNCIVHRCSGLAQLQQFTAPIPEQYIMALTATHIICSSCHKEFDLRLLYFIKILACFSIETQFTNVAYEYT
jgi:hypothetical protein